MKGDTMAFQIAYGAGHGLNSPGRRLPAALDPEMTREWVLNDRLARHFAEAAAAYPQVQLLRVDDPTGNTNVPLAERCRGLRRAGLLSGCAGAVQLLSGPLPLLYGNP